MFNKTELDEMADIAEKLVFNASCYIQAEPESSPDINPDTLQPIREEGVVKYDGPCQVEPTTRNYERAFDYGEIKQASRTYNVRVRRSFIDAQINDVITVYNSHDPAFAEGAKLIVIDPQVSSTASQRVMVAEMALGH